MNSFRVCAALGRTGVAAIAMLVSGAAYAADLSAPDSLKDAPGLAGDAQGGNVHATIPAGVSGGAMVGQGQGMLMYMPMSMSMEGNFVGTGKVPAATILATPNRESGPAFLRMVPESMDAQMHAFGVTYGVTDAINVMVMGNYTDKDMTMTTYNMMGKVALGTRTYSTDGFGDVSVTGLFRLYEDGFNHVHVNLGLSLPSGDTTAQITMLSPMGTNMTMRATYGMQLGTGTYDLLPGITYTGNKELWSWGAAYRARIALDSDQGYHWGDSHQVTGWLGYTVLPGVTATARIAGTVQAKIDGKDPEIFGAMQGANPAWYGGERIDLFGGIEIAGHEFGLGHTRLAIEAGAPVYQNLNGPQIGENWQLNAMLAVRF
jgi:hypothetical protein